MPVKTPSIKSHEDFVTLVSRLNEAAASYYAGDGTQLMDDASYDGNIRLLTTVVRTHPEWTEADDSLNSVAAGTSLGNVPHADAHALARQRHGRERAVGLPRGVAKLSGADEDAIVWSVEPKLDGMALSVRYVSGKLQRIVTRGNGRVGEDVTTAA